VERAGKQGDVLVGCVRPYYRRHTGNLMSVVVYRPGLAGYTVLWTLVLMLMGDWWVWWPAFIVLYPVAQAVQYTWDWLWMKTG
jgi:hypothetical protein